MMIWLPRNYISDGYSGESLVKTPATGKTTHIMDTKLMWVHIMIGTGTLQQHIRLEKTEDEWSAGSKDSLLSPLVDMDPFSFDQANGVLSGLANDNDPGQFGLVGNSDGTVRVHSDDYEVGEIVDIYIFNAAINTAAEGVSIELIADELSKMLDKVSRLEQEIEQLKNPE